MNDSTAVVLHQAKPLTAAEMRGHVNRVQEVMQAVMQKDVHFGIVPGSKKPSLYKPGAEVLAVAFHIAPSFKVEDLSDGDQIRYRVTATGTHQTTGIVLGEGMGECSSSEEKYKWRRAVCKEEWDVTPADRRRVKFSTYQGKVQLTDQVRTEPADIANTVLKMAIKRAQVAMCLNVTAASDCFTQDIEDLPEHLRDAADDAAAGSEPGVAMPKSKKEMPTEKKPTAAPGPLSEGQIAYLRRKLADAKVSEESICERFKIEALDKINPADWDAVKAELLAMG